MNTLTIRIEKPVARYENKSLQNNTSLVIEPGQNAAIIGPNGAGKSLLTEYMSGAVSLSSGISGVFFPDGSRLPMDKIATLSFRDIYRAGGAGADNYYQKRWQATEVGDSPEVQSLFADKTEQATQMLKKLKAESLLKKRVIYLSSGEVRKLMIVRSLLRKPQLLIVDNPFIGLDVESRSAVSNLLTEAAAELDIKLVIVVCHTKDLPTWADRVVAVKDKTVIANMTQDEFRNDKDFQQNLLGTAISEKARQNETAIKSLRNDAEKPSYDVAIQMNKINVRYGAARILKDVSWTVHKGERWSLTGTNGSGKSTLLSLVCGDHPQAYANDIRLFGRQRGSGESIWEIKKEIGYVSPDMHTFYSANISAEQVVASGFFDTIGLYRIPTEEQNEQARKRMALFECDHLAKRPFLQLSYGEQRIVLLTRAFAKKPSLLILDEPLHGLDAGKKAMAKRLIEAYCNDEDVTLIYVTHYAEEIPECIDHSAFMDKGSLEVSNKILSSTNLTDIYRQ